MLKFPDVNKLRVLGIDPGTDTLGRCIVDYVFDGAEDDHYGTLLDVKTLSGNNLISGDNLLTSMHGARYARIEALCDLIYKTLIEWKPDVVVCESPWLGRNPSTFATLVETLYAIRQAVVKYCPTVKLYLVDPNTAKRAVGVLGGKECKGKSKQLVQEAIPNLDDLKVSSDVDMSTVDEHGYDSIAVNYSYYRILQETVWVN